MILQKHDKPADEIWQIQSMKIKFCLGIFLLAAGWSQAQTNDLTALLQQGLFEEQASRNLPAAIADYQALAAKFDQDRQLAATAVFRLGECYRAQGRTNEAAAQYQRILHDFADQPTLATLSRQDLAGMGVAAAGSETPTAEKAAPYNADVRLWNKLKDKSQAELETLLPTLLPDAALDDLLAKRNDAQSRRALLVVDYATNNPTVARVDAQVAEWNRQIEAKIGGMMQALQWRAELAAPLALGNPARQQQRDLLTRQIALAEQNVAAVQKPRFGIGAATSIQVNAAESEVLRLRQELAALDASKDELLVIPADSDEDREIQRIQQMIQDSPDLINAPGSDGFTPLAGAAGHGWLKVAAYLLDHGAGVNAMCSQRFGLGGRTPLVEAVNAGNKAMAKFLIDRGADINFRGQNGDTALHLAAQKGFPAVAEMLLAEHADINARNNSGRTPLLCAMQQEQTKIIQMLLAAGADPNTKDNSGHTPLSYAAQDKNLAVVQLLLAVKADPNTEDSDGRTPLSGAVAQGGPQIVQQLLAAKADPNAGTLDAPLLVAIRNKELATAEMLLTAGANANAVGSVDLGGGRRQDLTPLGLATSSDQPAMVQLLLKYHADPNNTETDSQSMLFSALQDTNLLAALLDAHAMVDPVSKDDPGWTPLDAAASRNNAAAVELLLQHGANPNFRNSNGDTPLHWAADRTADRRVFELLLADHADPNVRDRNGRTPLDELKTTLADSGAAPEKKAAAASLVDWLRQHGALDKLPDWDSITVSRPAANFSFPVFRRGTNDWNQFTLLDAILSLYTRPDTYLVPEGNGVTAGYPVNSMVPFPDLTHVVLLRPSHDSTNETRRIVNLLNRTNEIDCAQDVSLEFGDTVEISEREHSLGEIPVGLTGGQQATLGDYVKGRAQLIAHGQKLELPFYRTGNQSTLEVLLNRDAAKDMLLSSSDLAHVKVIRHNPKTGQTREWILDCSHPRTQVNDLLLRDGDVIEVPEKP